MSGATPHSCSRFRHHWWHWRGPIMPASRRCLAQGEVAAGGAGGRRPVHCPHCRSRVAMRLAGQTLRSRWSGCRRPFSTSSKPLKPPSAQSSRRGWGPGTLPALGFSCHGRRGAVRRRTELALSPQSTRSTSNVGSWCFTSLATRSLIGLTGWAGRHPARKFHHVVRSAAPAQRTVEPPRILGRVRAAEVRTF